MPAFAVRIQPAGGVWPGGEAPALGAASARRAPERWGAAPAERWHWAGDAHARQSWFRLVVTAPILCAAVGEVRGEVQAQPLSAGGALDVAFAADETWVEFASHDTRGGRTFAAQCRSIGIGAGPFVAVGDARVQLAAARPVAGKWGCVAATLDAATLGVGSDTPKAERTARREGRERPFDAADAVRGATLRPAGPGAVDSAAYVVALAGEVRGECRQFAVGS